FTSKDIDLQKNNLIKGLKEFLNKARTVLVIVNDYTRPTPNSEILKLIEGLLKEHDVKYIVACGSHRAPNEREFRQIFGDFYETHKAKIIVHDASDNTSLFFLGKTRFGTSVWLNKAILWADKIITINSVEPHYFAGFTGGRKSFMPGIAGLETITHNHKLVINPKSMTLNLEGNPVHEDMTEITKMIPKQVFSIQLALDANHKILSIKFGDIFKSFYDSIEDAKRIFCVPIKEKTDIVVTVVQHPYDINFYQSQKAMENAKLALKDKGIIIAVSKCSQGVGEDNFVKFLASCSTPRQALKRVENEFKIGYQKVVRLSQLLNSSEVWTVMDIDDKIIQSVFMTPFQDINLAVQKALAKKGKAAKVLVLLDGSLTVPLTN
ncbi:MAG: nickel-dependent lactate racemase, partial [candidate division WOR-3 bacterium]|nr:nickel-dependent lactate racemase [candidate division WOR-3 bacterium]